MDIANILQDAQIALALIADGRQALSSVVSAVHDGKAAFSVDDQAQLDAMLASEEQQTAAAMADLRSAVAAYRAG